MDERQIDEALDRHMAALRAFALAFTGSVVTYLFVGWLLLTRLGLGGALKLPTAIIAVIVGAFLAVIVLGYMISRSMLARATDPGGGADGLAKHYIKATVAACALRETAAIAGFVLTLLTGDLTWVLLLAGASMFSMAVHWPRRDGVGDWMRRQRRSG